MKIRRGREQDTRATITRGGRVSSRAGGESCSSGPYFEARSVNFPQWSQWNQWGNAHFAPCHVTLAAMNSVDSHSPRNRQIAHFPPVIRPGLHERLAANERGQRLIKWLTPLPDAGGIPALLAGG